MRIGFLTQIANLQEQNRENNKKKVINLQFSKKKQMKQNHN